jgi:ribosomal RNA-processing protein 12
LYDIYINNDDDLDALSQDIIDQLLETMHVFIVSGNREVVKVALGFVKVAVTMLAMDRLEKHLEHLITAILRWSHDHKGRFKIKVRHIIERLIRRFGYEKIEACMPESDRKLIVNIRKRRQQAKRRREQAEQAAATAATTTTAIAAKASRMDFLFCVFV